MMIIFVVGPTAVGKSEAALDIAEKLGAEIINADAMQLYRGMDIGTAKLSIQERRNIKHHMLDVLDVTEEASVAVYQQKVRGILKNDAKSYIVVGGSGLYISSLLQDLKFPPNDPEVRSQIELRGIEIGAAALHKELAEKDPAAALAILPGNLRRIVRALEVIEITGQPFTATLPKADQSQIPHAHRLGISLPRNVLDQRIVNRVDLMWKQGFVDEVDQLIEKGLLLGKTARAALGYSQILTNRHDLELAREQTKVATKKYARRQESWFKRDLKIDWIESGQHMTWLEQKVQKN